MSTVVLNDEEGQLVLAALKHYKAAAKKTAEFGLDGSEGVKNRQAVDDIQRLIYKFIDAGC